MIVVRRVLLVTSVAVVGAVTGVAGRISELLGGAIPPWGVAVSVAAVPFILMSGLADAALNSLGRIGHLAASKTATTVMSLAVMAPLVIFFGLAGGFVQLFTGAVIGYAVSAIALRPYFKARKWAAEEPVDRGELRRLAVGAFAVGLAQMAVHAAVTGNMFVFRSLILVELGSVENGLYQGVMGLSRQYLGAVASGVFVYAYPVLSGLVERPGEFKEELDRALRFVLTISVPAALVLLGARDWIVRLVFTDEFLGMVPLMAWSLATDVVALVFGVLRIALLAAGRVRVFGTLGVAVELAYLTVFIFALRAWGIEGAVAAYLVSSVLGVVTFSAALWSEGLLEVRRGSLGTAGLATVLLTAAAMTDLTPVSRLMVIGTAAGWSWFFRDTLRRAFAR